MKKKPFSIVMSRNHNEMWNLFVCLLLAAAAIAVYWQVQSCDFIQFDDNKYVTDNQYVKSGLTAESIAWAFTTGWASNWHPLTWLSHMLDCELFGLNPCWHHITSLLFHITNTLLLFLVLKSMTGALWRCAFVAAAFALHPLHVESVAWISERKDVLSTLFWLLTMAAYLRYVKRPGIGRYLLTLIAFVLGLLAKPMLVTLPFVLLLLDYWPLSRFEPDGESAKSLSQRPVLSRLIMEKLPFFALSVVSSVVTFAVQRSGGAVARIAILAPGIRIANIFVSYVKYIGKMFWPSGLAILYPHPGAELPGWQVIISAMLLLGITVLIIRLAPRHRYLPFGWFWFLGTLVPVIGLVQVGDQAMADRYSYVPLVGLFIIIAWGAAELTAGWKYRKIILAVSSLVILSVLSVCTYLQLRHWRDSKAVFTHAVNVTSGNRVMHYDLGFLYQSEGRLDEAIEQYHLALQAYPYYIEAHNNLGIVLQSQGRVDQAVSHYKQALDIEPDSANVHYNLGRALAAQGKSDEAIKHYHRAVQLRKNYVEALYSLAKELKSEGRLDEAVVYYRRCVQAKPDFAKAHFNLANTLSSLGRLDEAIEHYSLAVEAGGDYAEAHNNLGIALASRGRLDEGAGHFQQALKCRPDYAEAHYNLAMVLKLQGKLDEALIHCRQAIGLKPDYVSALNETARILAGHPDPEQRNTAEAVSLAERAAGLTGRDDVTVLETLAMAYACAGQPDKAVATLQTALLLASDSTDNDTAARISSELNRYRQLKKK